MGSKDVSMKKTLTNALDWEEWTDDALKAARRLGLEPEYLQGLNNNQNVVIGGNGTIPENRRQKFRDLTDAIFESVIGGAKAWLKRQPGYGALTGGQLTRLLREVGRYDRQTSAQQRMCKKQVEKMKFEDRSEPPDIGTFLGKVAEAMRRMPLVYSVDDAAAVEEDNMNVHLIPNLRKHFGRGFHSTIDGLQDQEPPPSYDNIVKTIEKKLERLVSEGEYKIENDTLGKAFPASAVKRARPDDSSDDDADGEGTGNKQGAGVYMSKRALTRRDGKVRKKALQDAENGNTHYGGGKYTGGNKKPFQKDGGKGKGKGKGTGKSKGKNGDNRGGNARGGAQKWCEICKAGGHWTSSCWHNPYNTGTWASGPANPKGQGKQAYTTFGSHAMVATPVVGQWCPYAGAYIGTSAGSSSSYQPPPPPPPPQHLGPQ